MIEVASSPANLLDWKPDNNPFILSCMVKPSHWLTRRTRRVVPAGSVGPKATADAPVYEYWWTLRHPGPLEDHGHWFGGREGNKSWQDGEPMRSSQH